jgi:hypothetical protein
VRAPYIVLNPADPIRPDIELLTLLLIQCAQLFRIGSKNVRGAKCLCLSSAARSSLDGVGEIYVRCLVWKLQVVIEDGIVGVICLEKVLNCSRFSFWLYFEIEYWDWLEIDAAVVSTGEEAREPKWEAERREHSRFTCLD